MAQEQDILKMPAPRRPPKLTARRIGIHTSSSGGVENAAERAYRLGCNTLQIFSSSPRQWKPYELGRPQCEQMNRLRAQYDLKPLVIHTNYLINLAGTSELFLRKSIEAFRGEIERALALCAEYLVLHPGSFRGADRNKGLLQTAAAISAASNNLNLVKQSSRWAAASNRLPKSSSICEITFRWPPALIPATCTSQGTTLFPKRATKKPCANSIRRSG
jgi:endonuclease IV